MLGTFVFGMRDNDNEQHQYHHRDHAHGEDTENASGWEHFVRRINSCDDRRTCHSNPSPKDSVWLYVGISVLYFFLVAMVLLILLLAPKWTPLHQIKIDHHPHASIESAPTDIEVQNHTPKTEASEADDYAMMDSKEDFQGSPKDPLYDIDPRSSIFRSDGHKWIVPRSDEIKPGVRMRANSKFLHD